MRAPAARVGRADALGPVLAAGFDCNTAPLAPGRAVLTKVYTFKHAGEAVVSELDPKQGNLFPGDGQPAAPRRGRRPAPAVS